MSGATKGILFALLAFALYSTHDIIVKTVGGSYASFQIVFMSVLFGFPLSSVMLMRDVNPGTLIPKHPYWMAVRTLATVIGNSCAFYAFSVLPLADAYAIFFATPLLITVLAIPILGEKVRMQRGAAVVVGLIGVGIVLQPGQSPLTPGHFAAMGSAFCGALAGIVVRKIGQEERAVVMLIYPMMANFILMGALLPFVYRPIEGAHFGAFFLIACLSFLAMGFLIRAYANAEAAIIAPMQYSQIIWATLAGWILFSEIPQAHTVLGAGVIICSGLFIVFREARGATHSQRPVLETRGRAATPATPRFSTVSRIMKARNARKNGLAKPSAAR